MALKDDLLKYAISKLNTKIGDGECWTLINEGLKFIKAQTSDSSDLYKWPGAPVAGLSSCLSGYILQYNSYEVKMEFTSKITLGYTIINEKGTETAIVDPYLADEYQGEKKIKLGEPNHTAIFNNIDNKRGSVEEYEQNLPVSSMVTLNKHYIIPGKYSIPDSQLDEIKAFIKLNFPGFFPTGYFEHNHPGLPSNSKITKATYNGKPIAVTNGKTIKISLAEFLKENGNSFNYEIKLVGGSVKCYVPLPLGAPAKPDADQKKHAALFHPGGSMVGSIAGMTKTTDLFGKSNNTNLRHTSNQLI